MATKTPQRESPEPTKPVLHWLLDSDPSIRWQVMRDLMDEPDEVVAREPCINGRVVGLGAYFGEISDRLVDRLLGEQLTGGGWNRAAGSHSAPCERWTGIQHATSGDAGRRRQGAGSGVQPFRPGSCVFTNPERTVRPGLAPSTDPGRTVCPGSPASAKRKHLAGPGSCLARPAWRTVHADS